MANLFTVVFRSLVFAEAPARAQKSRVRLRSFNLPDGLGPLARILPHPAATLGRGPHARRALRGHRSKKARSSPRTKERTVPMRAVVVGVLSAVILFLIALPLDVAVADCRDRISLS